MHAPAKIQQLIAPRTACGLLYAKMSPTHKVSHDQDVYPVTCSICLSSLQAVSESKIEGNAPQRGDKSKSQDQIEVLADSLEG